LGVIRYRKESLHTAYQLPVLVPVGEPRWEAWDTPEAANRWTLGTLVDAETGFLKTLRVVARGEVSGKLRAAFSEDQLDWFIAIASLIDALRKNDNYAAKKFFARLLVLYHDAKTLHPKPRKTRSEKDEEVQLTHPEAEQLLRTKPELSAVWVTRFLGKFLSRARLVYWVRNGSSTPEPGMYCPDFYMAIVVHVLLGRAFRICPHCGVTFATGRPKQPKNYCSLRCQGAHRVARFRARNKNEKEGS
jgi:hypothetical protein